MKNVRLLYLLLLVIILLFLSYNQTFTGKSVDNLKQEGILLRVIDGDTIEAQVGNENQRIRLLGINTPEKNIPNSNSSKMFLSQFINKTIILLGDFEDEDKYNRKLRYIFYETRFLNLEIIENGFANTYYLSGLNYEKELIKAENQARDLEQGIWEKSKETCSRCISLIKIDPEREYFIIENSCNYKCELKAWFVKDAGRNTFYLDPLESQEQKTYSSNGKEIWNNNGDNFFMFDSKGKLVLYQAC